MPEFDTYLVLIWQQECICLPMRYRWLLPWAPCYRHYCCTLVCFRWHFCGLRVTWRCPGVGLEDGTGVEPETDHQVWSVTDDACAAVHYDVITPVGISVRHCCHPKWTQRMCVNVRMSVADPGPPFVTSKMISIWRKLRFFCRKSSSKRWNYYVLESQESPLKMQEAQ